MGNSLVPEAADRIRELVEHFPKYVSEFDRNPPFNEEQLRSHLATVSRRLALGTASRAVGDDDFLRLLHETLKLWRMDQRAAKLVSFKDFVAALRDRQREISSLEPYRLEDPNLNATQVSDTLWKLITALPICGNHAKLVSSTKALHHVLPDLVVPMDRAFTGAFFQWNAYNWQTVQERTFKSAFGDFAEIARATRPSQLIGAGWRTSSTKIIDNAIVGFCRSHHLEPSGLAELGKRAEAPALPHRRAENCKVQLSSGSILGTLRDRREDIKRLGVGSLGLFGSAARGEATEASDLDFLVELDHPTFDSYMNLLEYLENLFGRPVDLVLANTLKPQLREPILRETVHAAGL